MDLFCSGVAVESLLLGYEAVSMGNQIPTFREKILLSKVRIALDTVPPVTSQRNWILMQFSTSPYNHTYFFQTCLRYVQRKCRGLRALHLVLHREKITETL
jgi:hypothetical protein